MVFELVDKWVRDARFSDRKGEVLVLERCAKELEKELKEEKLKSHNKEYKQSCKGCEFEDISCGTCDTCKNFNMFTPKQA